MTDPAKDVKPAMRLRPRTLRVPTSPIADAHRWVHERTGGPPLLDLSQAAPGYPPAPVVAEHIARVASDGDGGRYAPPPGLPVLLEAFSAELKRSYGVDIGGDCILPTGGCNQAFCTAVSTIAEPGSEVILPVPYYFNHDMWLKLDGVVPRYLHELDVEQAEKLITDKTRALVIVTPGNPDGVTVPPSTIGEFHDLCSRYDIALILDETYRNFRTVTDPPHQLFEHPQWGDTVLSLHSFSKDLAIPGYRVGAIVSSEAFKVEALKFVDCVQICAPRIGQEAAAVGLNEARAWRQEQVDRINLTLRYFNDVMARQPGGFRLASAGAYFGWVQHPFTADGPAPTALRTDEVIRRLVVDHGIVAIPGTAFTPDDGGWIRFSYANLEPAQLDDFTARLDEMGANR